LAAFERFPCFRDLARVASPTLFLPSTVQGPVDFPPCHLHLVARPVCGLRSAGLKHGLPVDFAFAPHFGSFVRSQRRAVNLRFALSYTLAMNFSRLRFGLGWFVVVSVRWLFQPGDP
jgi:hypothetical protein